MLEAYAIHGVWDKIDDEKMKSVNFYGPMKDRYSALRYHRDGDHDSSLKSLNNWPDLIGGPMQFLVYYQIGMDYRYLNQHKKSLEYFNKIKYKFYDNSKNLVVSNSQKLSNEILNLIGEK